MKTLLLAPLVLLSLALPAFAQTQGDLNVQAKQSYEKADAELNSVWKTLMPHLGKKQKDKLVSAQLLWIKYRDSEAEARACIYDGGSIRPMIYFGSMEETTKQRTAILRSWLEESSR